MDCYKLNESMDCYKLVYQVSLLGLLPVDNVPDGLEVVDLDVLVLQVVGMFPCINGNQRNQRTGDGVLVCGGDHIQRAPVLLVFDDESPSRTLDSSQFGIGHSLQVVERAVLGLDSLGKFRLDRRRLASTLLLRSQVLPEKTVVGVSTSVEIDQLLQLNGLFDLAFGLGLGSLLNCLVVTADIGLVVLGVVDFVDLGRNVGLQRRKIPVQIGKGDLGSDGTKRSEGSSGTTCGSQGRSKHCDEESGKRANNKPGKAYQLGAGGSSAILLAGSG